MTANFEFLWEQYQPIVNGIAYQYGSKYRRHGAETADFSQEAVAWMLDNEATLAERYEEFTDPDEFGRWLSRCIENEFRDYALDIRDQAGGQPRQGAYWYSTGELKNLLPSMFDPEKWHEPPQSDGRSVGDPAHGGNWVATLADVAQAFARLEAEDQSLLRRFHEEGWRNVDLADEYGITEATMSYRHTRTLKRLLALLGGEKPRYMRDETPGDPWRGRHAISSAQARAITANQYESEG